MKMAHFKWLILIFCFTASYAQNQDEDSGKRLSSAVNSDAEELLPLMHPDGNRLYFSRIFHEDNFGGKYGGSDIWVSQINAGGDFEEATKLDKPINNRDNNFIIGFSADGKRMYLNNTYKFSNKYAVAVSELVEGKWTKPAPITLELPTYKGPIGMYMHPNEKILLISMEAEDSYGKEDLYIMTKNENGWQTPMNLGATINTAGYEISPFLSEDGKTLYFASEGHGRKTLSYKTNKLYNNWVLWDKLSALPTEEHCNFVSYSSLHADSVLFYCGKSNDRYLDIFTHIIKNNFVEKTRNNKEQITNNDKPRVNPLKIIKKFKKSGEATIYFNAGQFVLDDNMKEILWFIGNKILISNDSTSIIIKGYADDYDNEAFNTNLSDKRSIEVKKYLKTMGLSEKQIKIKKNMTFELSRNEVVNEHNRKVVLSLNN